MNLIDYTKNFAIGEPLLDSNKALKDFTVVIQFKKYGKSKTNKIQARTSADAVSKVRKKYAQTPFSKLGKDGIPGIIRAFESPTQDKQAQQYFQKLQQTTPPPVNTNLMTGTSQMK